MNETEGFDGFEGSGSDAFGCELSRGSDSEVFRGFGLSAETQRV